MTRTKYFKIQRFGVNAGTRYFAALSKEAVRKHVQKYTLDYSLDSLEPITEEQARKTPHFQEFVEKGRLCSDGTYSLGFVEKFQVGERVEFNVGDVVKVDISHIDSPRFTLFYVATIEKIASADGVVVKRKDNGELVDVYTGSLQRV